MARIRDDFDLLEDALQEAGDLLETLRDRQAELEGQLEDAHDQIADLEDELLARDGD